jgi:hypothetical protein
MREIKKEEEKYRAYEAIRSSGETNMFHLKQVIESAKDIGVILDRLDIMYIMDNYPVLNKKYK